MVLVLIKCMYIYVYTYVCQDVCTYIVCVVTRLQLFQRFEKFRIIVFGGDGSIGWVLSAVDKFNLNSKVRIYIVHYTYMYTYSTHTHTYIIIYVHMYIVSRKRNF